MNNDATNTMNHQEHVSILDQLTVQTTEGKVLKQSEIESFGVTNNGTDNWYMSAYTPADDKTHTLNSHIYNTEADARDGLDRHNKAVRSHIVVNDAPPPSVDELQRLYEQKQRHSKDNESRGTGSSNIYCDGDNY